MPGLKGQARLPAQVDPRVRRNAAGLATDFQGLVGGGIALVNGVLTLNLGAVPGLSQTSGLVTVVVAPLTLGVSGISLPAATNAVDGYLTAADHTTFASFAAKADYAFGANVFSGTGAFTTTGLVTAANFQISTAPTANSTGTVAIVAKDVNLLTANAGWLPLKRSDGTTVYVPYWL